MSGNDGNGGRVDESFDAGIPTDLTGDRKASLSTSSQEDAESKQDFKVGKWMNISNEKYRVYTFHGIKVLVDEPARLRVSRDDEGQDSHRIITKDGHGVYIARGWVCIEWETHEGLDPASF